MSRLTRWQGRRLLMLLLPRAVDVRQRWCPTVCYSKSRNDDPWHVTYFINWRASDHISPADVPLRPRSNEVIRWRSRLPLISNIWCTQMSSVIIWSASSSTPTDGATHRRPTARSRLSRTFASAAIFLYIRWFDWCKKQLRIYQWTQE